MSHQLLDRAAAAGLSGAVRVQASARPWESPVDGLEDLQPTQTTEIPFLAAVRVHTCVCEYQ